MTSYPVETAKGGHRHGKNRYALNVPSAFFLCRRYFN